MKKQTNTNAVAQTGANKRVHNRADIPGRIFIHDENRLFSAPMKNISAGGLYVGGLAEFPEGREVYVVVKSPYIEGGSIQARGTVVRVQGTDSEKGLAIQFTHISPSTQTLIQQTVDEERTNNEVHLHLVKGGKD